MKTLLWRGCGRSQNVSAGVMRTMVPSLRSRCCPTGYASPTLKITDEPVLSEIKPVSGFDLFNTSERYLNTAFNVGQAGIDGADVVFIKSTKGTGKTEVLSEIVKKLPSKSSVIQIGHRRSLSLQLAERLNLTSYLQTDGINKRFSLSVDTL